MIHLKQHCDLDTLRLCISVFDMLYTKIQTLVVESHYCRKTKHKILFDSDKMFDNDTIDLPPQTAKESAKIKYRVEEH